jgi:integrase/recombinase XerD
VLDEALVVLMFGQTSAHGACCNALSDACPYLFPNTRGKVGEASALRWHLNLLAARCEIRDANGKPSHFQPHQFRHTVATSMINNDVAQHIVQRFLGHVSPDMTARYTHLRDQTLKREYEKFRGRTVDVRGHVVA